MNNQKQIVIYPQGFAGFDIGLPIRVIKPNPSEIFNSLLYKTDIAKTSKAVVSNLAVEKMWKELIGANRFSSNFNFREEILVSALNAFGTDNFLAWIQLQAKNPYLGPNHIRFINDTFNFISGKRRALNIQYWLALLSEQGNNGNESVSINTETYFGTNKPLHMREPVDIKNALIKWVSQPGGYEDLLGTLHVFFGDSDAI